MSKRERRNHATVHTGEAVRARKGRVVLLFTVVIAIVIGLIIGFALVFRSPWIDAHRGQIVGLLGLALMAVLLSLPIIIEYERHPRHLSGPGKNPEQGSGPWKL